MALKLWQGRVGLLYLTSVFSYNFDLTAGAARPCKILNYIFRTQKFRCLFKATKRSLVNPNSGIKPPEQKNYLRLGSKNA